MAGPHTGLCSSSTWGHRWRGVLQAKANLPRISLRDREGARIPELHFKEKEKLIPKIITLFKVLSVQLYSCFKIIFNFLLSKKKYFLFNSSPFLSASGF